jgi:hypothetical protein
MLRIPHCLDNRFTGGGKVVSPTHPLHFTPQKHYYFYVPRIHFCKPQGLVRLERLCNFKKKSSHRVSNPRPSGYSVSTEFKSWLGDDLSLQGSFKAVTIISSPFLINIIKDYYNVVKYMDTGRSSSFSLSLRVGIRAAVYDQNTHVR